MPPLSLLIKPASGSCNMRCRYCFYVDETENRSVSSYGKMSRETVDALIDRAMSSGEQECTFAFQGGEPTLAGLDFFTYFVSAVAAHENPRRLRIHYALQTNGYRLDEEWARFFHDNHFLIGISLDGLKEIHDRYRIDAEGKGTYQRVMASIRLLEKHQVDFNVLVVLTAAAARNGQKIYRFFKKQNIDYQQYIECLDPIGTAPGGQEYSLTPKRYEEFLKNLFDAWYLDQKAGNHVYNRYFENLLMLLDGQMPESCSMRGICGKQWVIEADGSVYPCDFYALDQWLLGNIHENTFEEMDAKRDELGFIELSGKKPEPCESCRWFPLCRNGCRRHREPLGQGDGRTYFCSAYQGFFQYAWPRLREIYELRLR